MAKERDTKSPAAGAEQKKGRPRGSAGAPRGESATAGKGATATPKKPGQRKAGGERERRIQDRAYQIWEQEGRPSGREREHWERAERETGGQ